MFKVTKNGFDTFIGLGAMTKKLQGGRIAPPLVRIGLRIIRRPPAHVGRPGGRREARHGGPHQVSKNGFFRSF